MAEKKRTLSYHRATWEENLSQEFSLQKLITQAYRKLPNIDQRKISKVDSRIIEGRHQKNHRGSFYLHIASYTPDEPASIVPKVKHKAEADLKTLPPPSNAEFMDGDAMLLINKNDLILCCCGLREGGVKEYLKGIFELAEFSEDSKKFNIMKVFDLNVKNKIANQDITSLKLDAGLYESSFDHTERKTVKQSMTGSIFEQLKALFSEDSNLNELTEKENLNIEVTLSFDRRKKGGKFDKEHLKSLANKTMHEEDDGFIIRTSGGLVIRHGELTLSKKVELVPQGKSVFYINAWAEMETYFNELSDEGLIEQ